MKLSLILCCLISLLACGCAQSQDCPVDINKLPMYGNVKECKEQIEADKKFIASSEKLSRRKAAAEHMIMRGWQYLRSNHLDTSMMRFNQAWLLDSLNSEIYWGFGDNLGMQGNIKSRCLFLNDH
jgi:hypothetical protein